MVGKIFPRYFIILLVLLSFHSSPGGAEDALFSKAGINPIGNGKKAPNFHLEDINGKKVELEYYRGKVVFLNFWAPWCVPCKKEMPSMEELWKQFKDKNFVFLTISVDYAGVNPAKEFIGKQHYTFPVLIDPKCETLDLFEVRRIPATFLIDKKGMMVGKAIGPRDWKKPEVISIVNLLLEKKD
jgi:cytochrome c biogenesis protein CcmG/thiol:disulfide interchange protein DsbE